MARTTTLLTTLLAGAAAAALAAPAAQAKPASVAYALNGTALVTFDPAHPSVASAKPIDGVAGGETLVGIDVRPANGMLYGLGVDAVSNTGTLYVISPAGHASPVAGATGAIALVDAAANPIDLPVGDYGFDVNPDADRVRVTSSTSLNFRIDPNTGLAVDGNPGAPGTQPDAPINGTTTSVSGSAYTNAATNVASATTLYSLSAATDELTIQTPANLGAQTNPQALTLGGGAPLDVTAVHGFDLDPAVSVPVSNQPVASGDGYAILTVGGATHLYAISLVDGAAADLGPIGDGSGSFHGLALQHDLNDAGGRPAVGLVAGGTALQVFPTDAPAAGVTRTVGGRQPNEILVGIAWRPATGQLLGLGVDTTADTGTLYRLDPETGSATAIGTPGQVQWVGADGFTAVDLPPATVGWGIDVNPSTDRVRVVAGGGFNARISPAGGAPIDGNLGLPSPPAGTQPDAPHNGAATSVTATSFANAFAQPPTGGVTTQYALDPVGNRLLIQNPPNSGTLIAGPALAGGCGGTVDFDAVAGFDLPGAVTTPASGAEASGTAYAALTVSGQPRLYKVALPSGYVNGMGALEQPLSGLAVGEAVGFETYAIPSCVPAPPLGPPSGPNPNPIPNPEPPAKDRTAPRVTKLTVKARSKQRLAITFTTSEAGRATIELQRRASGRRDSKKRCVAGRKKGARCTLDKTYKTVTKTITKPGQVTVGASGRTGAVRVLVTVRDAAGNTSTPATKRATVKRR